MQRQPLSYSDLLFTCIVKETSGLSRELIRLPCVIDEVGRVTLAVADFGGYKRQFETRDIVRLKEVFSQRRVIEIVS
jgi:hypothetical protein